MLCWLTGNASNLGQGGKTEVEGKKTGERENEKTEEG